MGGLSAEHEVSLATGQNVIDNLDKSKYQAVAIKISKDKKWFLGGRLSSEANALKGCDLVFNALHGSFGEDGKAQSIMEYYGVRYTGSGICGSALAMDKLRSREIFKLAGLRVPNTLKIRKGDNCQALLKLFVGKVTSFPVVVKPCSSGSSVGVQIVRNYGQLEKAIKDTFKLDGKILIEEFISGKEVTCGVLENFNGQQVAALPVTEIVPKKGNKFFNYKAKYITGCSDEITPAFLDDELTKQVQETSIKTHQLLGCKAYSRTDMIIRPIRRIRQAHRGEELEPQAQGEGNDVFVLEANALPGLTTNSLFPKAARAAGLSFGDLLDKIISRSLT